MTCLVFIRLHSQYFLLYITCTSHLHMYAKLLVVRSEITEHFNGASVLAYIMLE